VFATATDDITATVTLASSRVVVATTIIDQTSQSSLTITETVTSPTTELVGATAYSTDTVATVTTTDETASATILIVTSVTIDETATATATITDTVTIDETESATATVTQTTVATVAPSVPTQGCSSLQSPYTNSYGKEFTLDCGHYYPVEGGGAITTKTLSYFAQCIDLCSEYSTCVGIDWDAEIGLCELFNSYHESPTSSYDSALLIAA
jgi:hypothetical protein